MVSYGELKLILRSQLIWSGIRRKFQESSVGSNIDTVVGPEGISSPDIVEYFFIVIF